MYVAIPGAPAQKPDKLQGAIEYFLWLMCVIDGNFWFHGWATKLVLMANQYH